MIGVCPILYVAYKVLKRSRFYKPEEVDLFKNLDEIEEHQTNYQPRPAKYATLLLFSTWAQNYLSNHVNRNTFERVLDFLFG